MANQDDKPIIMDPAAESSKLDNLHVTVPSGPIVGKFVDRARSPWAHAMEVVANFAEPFVEEAQRQVK